MALSLVPLTSLPPPPDGGWGWVVVAASFFCNVIGDGIGYTFGLLLPHLVDSFESDRWMKRVVAGGGAAAQ
jgi:hypothetical protein